MSFRTSRQNTAESKVLNTSTDWVRNPEWMTMPATTSAQEQVDLLVAVYPESPYFALNFTTSTGNYIVDWGDGTTPQSYGSNTQANYLYDYNASGLTGPGTLPYKQAIVKITPAVGGATLSVINLQVKNSASNLQTYITPILDITISATCGSLIIGASSLIAPLRMLERCVILRQALSQFLNTFQSCSALQSVSTTSSAAINSVQSMFQGCSSLQIAPLLNLSGCSNYTNMFNGCSSLREVPLYSLGTNANLSGMFNNCRSLQSVPLFNTVSVTNMSDMFNGCTGLITVPLFNTVSVTNMSTMFQNCLGLQIAPLFNTAAVTNMTSMFNGCASLKTVPAFNTAAVTTFASMFSSCSALQSAPAFATNAVTGTTAFTSMFNSCSSLQEVPDMNFNRAAITTSASYTNMFNSCVSLSRINLSAGNGPKFTFTVAFCKLSAASLDQLYTSLPTVTGQTITVTGNVGIAGDNPAIATAKGWSVVGS